MDAAPIDELSSKARFPWQAMLTGNQWGGLDIHHVAPRRDSFATARVNPIDGEWEAGVEIHLLTANGVGLRSVSYSGPFDADRVLRLLEAVVA